MLGKTSSIRQSAVINISLMAVVALLMIFSVDLVRNKLLENAQEMGNALAASYVAEEERILNDMRTNAVLAKQYIDEITSGGGSEEEIRQWLQGYFVKLSDIMGEGIFDPYAVINGEVVAANPWEGDDTYDYTNTQWYTLAQQAKDQVAITSAYEDAITGQKIMTLCIDLSRPGDVLAFDIYIENPDLHRYMDSLPDYASLYLCDEEGSVLYSHVPWEITDEKLQEYADYLLEGIRDGTLLPHDSTYKDKEGETRSLYFAEMSNGWTMILTLPVNQILMGSQSYVVYVLAGVSILLFIILGFLTVRNEINIRAMKRTDDTVHILGDSFYAVYRVDFQSGRYEVIKAPEDIRSFIASQGTYSALMENFGRFVEPGVYREFRIHFSLDQIRQRVKLGIQDYGGDYQRRFGEEYRWVNVRTLYNKKVAPSEVIFCFRDVDEEKRLQMQHSIILTQALEEARKSAKAKSDFFSGMSHDMRTPLNAIIGFCSLAEKHQKQGDYTRVGEFIKKINTAGNQLLVLINDILELSRIEARKTTLNQEKFDLEQMVEETAEMFRERAAEDKKTLHLELEIRNRMVESDRNKLIQILNNLLSNAFKYSNPGATVWLRVRQFEFQQYNRYQFSVEDNGIGMSKSFQEHLFDPYSRETAFTSAPVVGSGLGMAIVKSYVQQLSGEILVESELGKGSCFTVTVPMKVAEPENQEKSAPPVPREKSEFCWEGCTVLIAEDNEMNGEILSQVLEMKGARVKWARNGMEAVEMFSASPLHSIRLILMDMQMPKMDGCQAAAAIRELDRSDAGRVPIIAVTANAFAEDIAKTTQAGMNDHVSKPIDFDLLEQKAERLLSLSGTEPDQG